MWMFLHSIPYYNGLFKGITMTCVSLVANIVPGQIFDTDLESNKSRLLIIICNTYTSVLVWC